MSQITSSMAARKALVVSLPKSSLDLLRYRRRWLQSRFGGLSVELADAVAELAFANRWGRL